MALVNNQSDYLAHIGPLTIIADLSPNDLRGILIQYIKILKTPNPNDSKLSKYKEKCQEITFECIKKLITQMQKIFTQEGFSND